MRFLITENVLYYDYLSDYDAESIIGDFLTNPKGRLNWRIIPFDQYKQALEEFMKYGKFMRFPTDNIYKWMGGVLQNIAKLSALTGIAGHKRYYEPDPETAYYLLQNYIDDEFDEPDLSEIREKEELSGEQCSNLLYHMGFWRWCSLPDGSDAYSDYGLGPLEKLAVQYNENMSPEELIVLINKILDVSHQRGDLASMFIEGGARALTNITYNENKKGKTVYLSESALQIIAEATLSLDDVYQKYYSKIPYEDFTKIVQSDPTTINNKMGKYSKWLLNLYYRKQLKIEDLYKAKEYLTTYNKFINKIQQKDINQIKSLPDLYELIKPFEINPDQTTSNKDEIRKAKENSTKVYEDDQWLVVVPKTKEAACYYGKGTKWCTASSDNDYKNNMFDAYSQSGNLYININKNTGRKYQFQFNGADDSQFMDEQDREITKPIPQTIGMSEGLVGFYYDFESEDNYNYDFYKLYFDDKYGIIDLDMRDEWEDRIVGIAWDENYGVLYGTNGVEYEQLSEPISLDFAVKNSYTDTIIGQGEKGYGFVAINGLLPVEKHNTMNIGLFDVQSEKFIVPMEYPNIMLTNKYIILIGQTVTAVNIDTKQITFSQPLMENGLIGRKREIIDIFIPLGEDSDIAISYTYGKEGGYVLINMATNKIISKDIIDPTYYRTEGEWLLTNDIYRNDIKIHRKTGKIEQIS